MTTFATLDPVFKTTVGGTKYGLLPVQASGAAPTVVLLGSTAYGNLTNPDFARQGWLLHVNGWNVASLDAPCHGEDLRAGERPEILGWADRFQKGEDAVAAFVAHANDVMDQLVMEKVARPGSIAVSGISRGGFLAFHVAAGNARVGAVCAMAPVTDWGVLREFAQMKENPLVKSTALINWADKITCPVWTIIGSADDRVDTSKAMEFMQHLLANNTARAAGTVIDLHVTSTPGHQSFAWWHDEAARWLGEWARLG